MGKAMRVTATYLDTAAGVAAANRRMAATNDAVVAVFQGVVYLADKGDLGVEIKDR